jgi:hypothetical protein
MEIEIKEYKLPAEIKFNFEELKQEVIAKCSLYESMIYTEDQIKDARADKASLNKLKKALNDERLRLEREYMKPFESFKSQVKELCTLIDKPVMLIDKQITAAEEERKNKKRVEIGQAYCNMEHPDWLQLNRIFNEKWLNASYKMSDIKDELEVQLAMIKGNIDTLATLEFGFEALDTYKRSLDFHQAIMEGQRLADLQKQKEAQKAREAEKEAERANIPTTEEKAEIEPNTCEILPFKEDEPTKWFAFGGFFTASQVVELQEWAKSKGIELTEV